MHTLKCGTYRASMARGDTVDQSHACVGFVDYQWNTKQARSDNHWSCDMSAFAPDDVNSIVLAVSDGLQCTSSNLDHIPDVAKKRRDRLVTTYFARGDGAEREWCLNGF